MILHSERLLIRPGIESDKQSLLEVFRNPSVRRFLLDDTLVSAEWVRDELAASAERFATSGAGLWTIQFPEESRIIGFAGFRDFFDPPRPQLLYGLFPELCGQGLATEAAWQLCDHAFSRLGFSRIEAATDRPNEKSIAVLVRLGMLPMTASNQMPDATLFYEIEHGRWRWRELNVAARKPQSTKVSLTQESLKQ